MKITADTDRYIREVIEGNEYSFLFKDLVVLDVGCNIGTFSLWIYGLARKIYAIDIAQENIDNLLQTIKDNKLDRVETFHCGIGGKTEGRSVIGYAPPGDGDQRLTGPGELPCYSLKDFLEKEAIDYIDVLKLDVEGAEQEILLGVDFPADKIWTIIGELHYGDDVKLELQSRLSGLGYQYYDLGGHFMARKR